MKILIGCRTNADIYPHNNQSYFFSLHVKTNLNNGPYLVKAQQFSGMVHCQNQAEFDLPPMTAEKTLFLLLLYSA